MSLVDQRSDVREDVCSSILIGARADQRSALLSPFSYSTQINSFVPLNIKLDFSSHSSAHCSHHKTSANMAAGSSANGSSTSVLPMYDKTPLSHLLDAAVQKTYHELFTMTDMYVFALRDQLDRFDLRSLGWPARPIWNGRHRPRVCPRRQRCLICLGKRSWSSLLAARVSCSYGFSRWSNGRERPAK